MKKNCYIMLLILLSCSKTHDKKVVKDRYGNYYYLDGDNALGDERYVVRPVDTTYFKTFK